MPLPLETVSQVLKTFFDMEYPYLVLVPENLKHLLEVFVVLAALYFHQSHVVVLVILEAFEHEEGLVFELLVDEVGMGVVREVGGVDWDISLQTKEGAFEKGAFGEEATGARVPVNKVF